MAEKNIKWAPGESCATLAKWRVWDFKVMLPVAVNCNDAWDVMEALLSEQGWEFLAAIADQEIDVDQLESCRDVGLDPAPFMAFMPDDTDGKGDA